jgi:predicted homoserine dehydrogenase-like protein
MPRYYFHVRRGQTTILDHEGIELADAVDVDVEAAKRAQQSVNGEILERRVSLNAKSTSQGRIIVTDDWETLFEFPF